jgi:hypothetical protein
MHPDVPMTAATPISSASNQVLIEVKTKTDRIEELLEHLISNGTSAHTAKTPVDIPTLDAPEIRSASQDKVVLISLTQTFTLVSF